MRNCEIDRLRQLRLKEDSSKEKHDAMVRLIERLSEVRDSAFEAYRALERLFEGEEEKKPNEAEGVADIS